MFNISKDLRERHIREQSIFSDAVYLGGNEQTTRKFIINVTDDIVKKITPRIQDSLKQYDAHLQKSGQEIFAKPIEILVHNAVKRECKQEVQQAFLTTANTVAFWLVKYLMDEVGPYYLSVITFLAKDVLLGLTILSSLAAVSYSYSSIELAGATVVCCILYLQYLYSFWKHLQSKREVVFSHAKQRFISSKNPGV